MQGGHGSGRRASRLPRSGGRYEAVVDDFLRDELNYIVVKSWDAADEGLRLLRTDVDGRATFLVHPEDSQAKFSFSMDDATLPGARPSEPVVPLKSCIRVLDGFGKSLEVILPKLRQWLHRSRSECRPRAGAGKSRRVLPLAVGRMLPQRDRHRRQAAQPGPAFDEARTARRAAADGRIGAGACGRRKLRVCPGPRDRRARRPAATPGRREARRRETGNDVRPHAAPTRVGNDARARAAATLMRASCGGWRRSAARVNHCIDHAEERNCRARTAEPGASKRRCRLPSSLEKMSLRQRREAGRSRTHRKAWQMWPPWKSDVARAVGTVQRIESMVTEMSQRALTLRVQIESAAAEKQQRETENLGLAEQSGRTWAAERAIAAKARQLLQLSGTSAGTALAGELKRRSRSPARCWMQRATAAANSRRRRRGCSPTRSTWPKPACRNSASSAKS